MSCHVWMERIDRMVELVESGASLEILSRELALSKSALCKVLYPKEDGCLRGVAVAKAEFRVKYHRARAVWHDHHAEDLEQATIAGITN